MAAQEAAQEAAAALVRTLAVAAAAELVLAALVLALALALVAEPVRDARLAAASRSSLHRLSSLVLR